MTTSLGKRKRPDHGVSKKQNSLGRNGDTNELEDQDRIQEIFRQHFETTFKPLPSSKRNIPEHRHEDDLKSATSEEDEWSGCSSDEEVLEVDYADGSTPMLDRDKHEWRAFMVWSQRSVEKCVS
jgi:hypothetical protein